MTGYIHPHVPYVDVYMNNHVCFVLPVSMLLIWFVKLAKVSGFKVSLQLHEWGKGLLEIWLCVYALED